MRNPNRGSPLNSSIDIIFYKYNRVEFMGFHSSSAITTLYYQAKISIGFWYSQNLNIDLIFEGKRF